MAFTETTKQKVLAIVRIFETGKAEGDFGAVAVLNDGAGVSYGIGQFTHRSGALLDVVDRYRAIGGEIARNVLERRLSLLQRPTAFNIRWLGADSAFKKALKAAAISSEMKAAQVQIADERYLRPAIEECERLGFVTPLALAVVYDSITHGSWEKIRDRVVAKPSSATPSAEVASTPPQGGGELKWITEYVRRRDAWLASIPRLAVTRYRTRFFLNQIAITNWDLSLPMLVHGVRLTEELIADQKNPVALSTTPSAEAAATPPIQGGELRIPAVGPNSQTTNEKSSDEPPTTHQESSENPQAQPSGFLDEVERRVNAAVAKFDQTERVVVTVAERTDRAKSLWTTALGTIWQTLWAILGWVADVPREVWLVVAIIAGALTLLYLYRQISLGKIRESRVSGE